jgi:hypothetical protein
LRETYFDQNNNAVKQQTTLLFSCLGDFFWPLSQVWKSMQNLPLLCVWQLTFKVTEQTKSTYFVRWSNVILGLSYCGIDGLRIGVFLDYQK